MKRKPNGYWNPERQDQAATQYSTRLAFQRGSPGAYHAAQRAGRLDICCSHMVGRLHKPKDYWTPERQDQAASQYPTRLAFHRGNPSAYNAAWLAGRLEICCSHMEGVYKPDGYWAEPENQDQAAAQYQTRSAFHKGNRSAYTAARLAGRLDSCCKNMKRQCNLSKRGVYAFEFPGKICYIGLTYNFDKRYAAHTQKEGPVFDYIKQHDDVAFEFKKLSEYMDPEEAAKLEAKTIEKYKLEGWLCLNKQKAGGLGGNNKKWPKAKCAEKAREYKTKNEFRTKAPGAYESARINGWLDEITNHMPKRASKWNTIEKVEAISSKYKSRSEFCRKARGAYNSALRHGWMDILFPKQ